MKDAVVVEEPAIVVEAPLTEKTMLEEFMTLQSKRCQAYNTLHRCMGEYRANKQLCAFTDTMRKVTSTFQTVSVAIIQLHKDLQEAGFEHSADLIEKLQDMEQLKLKLTAEAHIKQQALKTSDSNADRLQLYALNKQQGDLITDINEVLEEIRYQAAPEV